jgi:tetratricopeptide (TPR) repeat protein
LKPTYTSIISVLKQGRLILFVVMLVIAGCSLEKKSAVNRGLQNLTARYNILFNANEILRAKQESYEAGYVDDYNELLSVYRDTVAKSDIPDKDLDAVKAKANTIISVKEQSHYLGDAYLLLSKANYLDGNYFDAVEYANYVIRSFGNQPDLKQEALVWKARSMLYINQPDAAKRTLDTALQNINPKKRITADVYATRLQYDINTQNYSEAEEMAKLAIQYSHSKVQELRWTFILGQLQELNQEPVNAIASYSRVANSNALFDMAFNANLNRIRIEDKQNGVKISRVNRLRSLLRNSNNREFTDQIYYQIGELQYGDKEIDNALKSYRLSVNNSTKNQSQKGLSYLRMADIYFKNKADYTSAKKYYDSTLVSLPPAYPGYATILKKSDNLQLLADRYQIIAREDTLQMLAAMDEKTRADKIEQMLKVRVAQLQPETLNNGQPIQSTNVNGAPQLSTPNGGNFYFYNVNAVSQGFSDFKRVWGNRRLEDNWRQGNRPTSDIANNAPNPITTATDVLPANQERNPEMVDARSFRQDLLQNLPLTPVLLAQSNKHVFDAYLDIANFYRDVLDDKKEAIAAYELLITRFPDNQSKAAIYYNLYRLYSESNPSVSDKYKDLVVKSYPETPFAKTILDPDYSKRMNDEDTGFSTLYNHIYDLYAGRKYTEVITAADALLAQYPNNRLAAQISYLRAFAAGHQERLAPFNTDLQHIVSKYPDDKLITPLVNQHLAYITANQAELTARSIVISDRETNDQTFTLPIVYQQQTEYRAPSVGPIAIVPDAGTKARASKGSAACSCTACFTNSRCRTTNCNTNSTCSGDPCAG